MVSDVWFRLRALFRRKTVEAELDDELRFHLDRSVEAHLAAGKTQGEALRLARLELGGLEATKEDCRDARGVRPLDDLVADVGYGLRVLRRSPGFTAVAVITLALGIGANSAMFSVVNAVLLHPLPYPDPGELLRVHARRPGFEQASISWPNFSDWRDANRSFAHLAVSRSAMYTLTSAGPAERVQAELVSADYFAVLGVPPLLGRGFVAGEDQPGVAPVLVLGEGLWRKKYGAAPDVLGKPIVVDGKSYTVIGVVPARIDVRALSGGQPADVYLPMGQWANPALQSRTAGLGIHGIGRLRPGVSVEQARADLDAVTRHLAEVYPEVDRQTGATLVPLDESIVGDLRPYLYLLLGGVGLVLLIACANVANLLLARAAARSRELGIRLALGASLGRLVRQLLTESLLLAVAGGLLGLVVAAWGTRALLLALPRIVPRVEAVGVDTRVILFTAAVALVAGLISGLAPALHAVRRDLHGALREGGRGASSTRHRAQAVFVVLEMAMALVLLVGAGLLVRTLHRLWSVDPGFRAEGVVTFGLALSPSLPAAGPAAVRAELRRIETALAAAPGVESVALANAVPIEADDQLLFWPGDRPEPATSEEMSLAARAVVGPAYFSTMRIPLIAGRMLTPRDDENAALVVIVDEVFARTYFPGESAVGKRVHIDDFGFEPAEIVGVVGHVKQWGLDQDETMSVRSQLYQAFAQMPDSIMTRAASGVVVLARARGAASLRAVVDELGSDNVMFRVRTLEEIIAGFQATRRFAMVVLAGFAALALLLACVGIYGVVSYMVAQRTTEIGIRMALGARAGDILGLVLRQGIRLALAGVALGLVAAIPVTRAMGKLVYGVPATDPITFAGVAFGLLVVALTATLLPARRAMRMDPMRALRED